MEAGLYVVECRWDGVVCGRRVMGGAVGSHAGPVQRFSDGYGGGFAAIYQILVNVRRLRLGLGVAVVKGI